MVATKKTRNVVLKTLPIFSVVLAVGLTILSGVIHGEMTGRWGPSDVMAVAVNRFDALPKHFGGWYLKDEIKLDDYAEQVLQCAGYINHQYVHQDTGEIVNVAVLLGPTGPISVHTPEICYSSRAYKQVGPRRQVSVETSSGMKDALWVVDFQSTTLESYRLRVYYAWTAEERWLASSQPRFDFAGQPYLFKLQLAALLPPHDDEKQGDVCRRFLEDFLPVVREQLLVALYHRNGHQLTQIPR